MSLLLLLLFFLLFSDHKKWIFDFVLIIYRRTDTAIVSLTIELVLFWRKHERERGSDSVINTVSESKSNQYAVSENWKNNKTIPASVLVVICRSYFRELYVRDAFDILWEIHQTYWRVVESCFTDMPLQRKCYALVEKYIPTSEQFVFYVFVGFEFYELIS